MSEPTDIDPDSVIALPDQWTEKASTLTDMANMRRAEGDEDSSKRQRVKAGVYRSLAVELSRAIEHDRTQASLYQEMSRRLGEIRRYATSVSADPLNPPSDDVRQVLRTIIRMTQGR